MSNKDSQNIFSSYYTNVLLENTVNELTGQDRAKLSRLEHLKELIQTQKDITEEDRKKALFQINGAIAKLKGETFATTDSESEDSESSTSKTPYTDDEGNISVGPNTSTGTVTYGGPMPTDVLDAEFDKLEQEDPDAVETNTTRRLSYEDGTEIPVDPNNPTIAAGDEEFGIGRFKKPKTGRVVVKPDDQSQGSFSRPRRVR
jgi:hypothetical protein